MGTQIYALSLDQVLIYEKAKKIFKLNFDDVLQCMDHQNVINGLDMLINVTKQVGCVTQDITEKVNLSMEIGIIFNLVARVKGSEYSFKINHNKRTFYMNIVCDGIRFTITLNKKRVTYRLILAELDPSELTFDSDRQEEETFNIVKP